ncbi:MAG: Tll0287-like domain-containing protein [Nitrospiraceae bacterium]
MNPVHGILIIIVAGLILLSPQVVPGATLFEAEETARLIAALLDSGRKVIDQNQGLINDRRKGHKGFTPEVFERQLVEEFRTRTGVDLTRLSAARLPPVAGELLRALVSAGKAVVADAQAVINQRGVGYKNFIPATFGSQAAERFSAASHVHLKQTTLQPRNPKNAPDPYEEAVLRRLITQPGQSVTISNVTDEGKTLRVLTPIYYTRDCLMCHGAPAGELDVSGFPKEGATDGDLAGAISVMIPLDDARRER